VPLKPTTYENNLRPIRRENLDALRKSGHITLMDSAHKTNKHGWKLYTVLVRDSFGSWLAGGHFFVSGEEQVIVGQGRQVVKR
jgi:hypothetical protein